MPLWLCKTEPSEYSFDDLLRDGSAVWDGIGNALARKHLAAMAKGDRVLLYHTGKEKAVVGEMVVAKAGPEPTLKPVRKLSRPVTLAEIKADAGLADWDLVRIGRLSVVPVTSDQWQQVMAMASDAA